MSAQDPVSRRKMLLRLGWAVPVVMTVGLTHKAFAQYEVDCRKNPNDPACEEQ